MAEQQTEQAVWRVVTHERNGGGWWTVCPNRFWERAEAEGWAAGALRRGASNAGVYPEVGGRVQVPGWIKVRAEGGKGMSRTRVEVHVAALERQIAALDRRIGPLQQRSIPFVNESATIDGALAQLRPLQEQRAALAAQVRALVGPAPR